MAVTIASISMSWQPAEIMKMKMVSDVQVSPNNQEVLYVATESDLEKNVYITKIYKGDAVLESNAFSPRWSPDGKSIAFIADREDAKNLYLIPAEGGEAIQLTKEKAGVQTFKWSPDGKKIAFVMGDETQKPAPIVYKKDHSINRLWLIELGSDAQPVALTPKSYYLRGMGDFGTKIAEFDWSPDGQTIAFAYTVGSGHDHYFMESAIATLDLRNGQVHEWEKRAPFEAMPHYSPDGKWIATVTGESNYTLDRQVAIRSADGKQFKLLAPTFNEGVFLGGPNLLGWNREGTHVLFFEPKRTKYHIEMLPIDGGPGVEWQSNDVYFDLPSLSPDKTTLGMMIQSPTTPQEVFVTRLDHFAPKQISQLNAHFASFRMPKTELIRWKSYDGCEIEGILTYPLNYTPEKTHPLLLVIHGGPMGFFRENFIGTPYVYPMASFAEHGYFTLRPNPRGSTGYGKEFRSANRYDWGGKDFEDLMSGIDHLVAQRLVDENQLGVMGWSYGGYMTGWAVTQTNRFKAASMGAGPYNLISMTGTTDLHRLVPYYLGHTHENKHLYDALSPLYHVDKVKTPCLIQHGMGDLRVPISQSYELYHALKNQGKEVNFLIYPDTTHYFEKPLMELHSLEKNLQWFNRYVPYK